MKYVVGIDIGTTHTKAIIAGTDGKVVYEDKSGYELLQLSPGLQEQDPEEVFEAFVGVLTRALASGTDQSDIAAISFSSAMHGFMAVDGDNKPLTNFITWADLRSQSYALELKNTELGRKLHAETGTAIHPMSPLCKIAWLKHEKPEIFSAARKFISIKEFIFYRLFGKYLIDYSVASATGIFQTLTLNWHPEALKWLGISADELSEPVPSTHIEHLSDQKMIGHLGITSQIPFVIGSSDGCLAVLGSGAIHPNEVALTIGTSSAVRKSVDKPTLDPRQQLFNYVLQEGWYVSGGASNNGGNVPRWFSEKMLVRSFDSDEAFTWFMDHCDSVDPGSEGLLFLPYIYGERSPVWDADAKGIFLHVKASHGRAHFMRAILEGVAYSLNGIIAALEESGPPIDTIYASGGFIKSLVWLQIVADVTGKKILISHEGDASALGAVFMGMAATGLMPDLKQVKTLVRTGQEIFPRAEFAGIYSKGFDTFRRLISVEKDLREI